MSDAIRAGYVRVDGVRTFYEEVGPAEGQDVVLVHTAGHDAMEWRHVLPALGEAGYHALTLDLPGHGKSLPHPDGHIDSMHGLAEFVRSFADARGVEQPVVAGCSIGGDIVLDLAAHHSRDLAGVAACEGALRTPTYPEGFLGLMEHESGLPGWGRFFYNASRHCHGEDADPERVEEHAWLHQRAIPEVAHADLTAWNDHDIRDRADDITCPVLYVYGEDDYFLPEEFVEETRAMLDPEFVRMENVGHYPMLETDAFTERFLAFLESV
jgi:pimeloyl-ACP methyl ester carboxylesterase